MDFGFKAPFPAHLPSIVRWSRQIVKTLTKTERRSNDYCVSREMLNCHSLTHEYNTNIKQKYFPKECFWRKRKLDYGFFYSPQIWELWRRIGDGDVVHTRLIDNRQCVGWEWPLTGVPTERFVLMIKCLRNNGHHLSPSYTTAVDRTYWLHSRVVVRRNVHR